MSRPSTRSSSQALLQPPVATEVNVIKVIKVLLERLENIGKWKVRKIADELQKDAQEAMELKKFYSDVCGLSSSIPHDFTIAEKFAPDGYNGGYTFLDNVAFKFKFSD